MQSISHLLRALGPEIAVGRDESDLIIAGEPIQTVTQYGSSAFDWLNDLENGFWVGGCTYDLGRAVEHVPEIAGDFLDLPDLCFTQYRARVRLGEKTQWEGDAGAIRRMQERVNRYHPSTETTTPQLSGWKSSLDFGEFTGRIDRIKELLANGDCYQVNLTRQLQTEELTDPLELFIILLEYNPSPHACFAPIGNCFAVSASPERFLRWDRGEIETRPIKGTHEDGNVLSQSAKDQAENVMIVDLARNDLGRVCDFGSVSVPELFTLEAHPGLYHLVSTVHGRARKDVGLGDTVRAMFPAASITGAPKPRVMQIIEQLEPVRRGLYCGALGWIDADRDIADFAVAIRTFTCSSQGTSLGVGCGIVADSNPEDEWDESELKIARLLEAAGTLVKTTT